MFFTPMTSRVKSHSLDAAPGMSLHVFVVEGGRKELALSRKYPQFSSKICKKYVKIVVNQNISMLPIVLCMVPPSTYVKVPVVIVLMGGICLVPDKVASAIGAPAMRRL